MEMIVIYDNTGHIYYCAGGSVEEPVGLPFLRIAVPEGKILKSVDVSGDKPTPVFEDVPKSEYEQKLEQLQSQLDYLALMTDVTIE